MTKNPRSAENRKRWLQHVEACKGSGLSQAEYARRQGLRYKSLSYWFRGVRRQATTSGHASVAPHTHVVVQKKEPAIQFASVSERLPIFQKKLQQRQSTLTLQVGMRYRVRIPPDFSSKALLKIIRVLEHCR